MTLWLDRYEIKPGDYLRERINEGIVKAKYFIAVLSPASIKSEWVKREIDSAMIRELDEKRIRLIPVLIGSMTDKDIPGDIRGKLYLDFRNDDKANAALERLIDLLKPEVRLRKEFLKELRAGLPEMTDRIARLSEIVATNRDQTIQQAAIRGLLTIGTPPAVVAIVERLYGVWGCTTLKYCIQGLSGRKDTVGHVALAATIFWDDRFVSEKLGALMKGLDGLYDIRSFVESQSRDGKISLFSITAAIQEHTPPEVAAAFDYSCQYLPRSTELLLLKPLFSEDEIKAKKKVLDKALPGLTELIGKKLPALNQTRREAYALKMKPVRLDPNKPDPDDPLFVGY